MAGGSTSRSSGPTRLPQRGPGPVMLIGGAEDKLKDRVILQRFLEFAGGPDGHIVVISTASSLGEEATEFYRMLFEQMGASRISGLRPVTRDEGNDPQTASAL